MNNRIIANIPWDAVQLIKQHKEIVVFEEILIPIP
jgi:hypothetical protein